MTCAHETAAAVELEQLLAFSARLGRQPLLVQAASGNTSAKLDGTLWIKASGKWLAHAGVDDILIPLDLCEARRRIAADEDPCSDTGQPRSTGGRASVETAMHAVLPWRIVAHVHSVSTIALAVRSDGEREIASRLRGMNWAWVRYVPSGLALANAVQQAMRENPCASVLVLANHGLVVGAETCEAAERLLIEVECRLAAVTRWAAEPDIVALQELAAGTASWRVARSTALQAAAMDPDSRRILLNGILYPCQAIFLSRAARCLPRNARAEDLSLEADPFVVVEGAGMLVRDNLSQAQMATLEGLAEVLRRIPASAPIRYLDDRELDDLLCADVYRYRARAEGNCRTVPPPAPQAETLATAVCG